MSFILLNLDDEECFLRLIDVKIVFPFIEIEANMLALNLNRVDYLQTGVTSSKSMKVLPISEKATKGSAQKVVVGDFDGVLTCFGIKKHIPQIQFKTLPSTKITRLALGGLQSPSRDKIFVATNAEIKGYSKKGKQFLSFDTNLTETIQSIYVEGPDLYVCGSYIYNHYHDCQDQHYFLAPDKVNDILVIPPLNEAPLLPVLGCQDRVLRVLNKSELHFEIEVAGSPVVLTLEGKKDNQYTSGVVYGTTDGKIGCVRIGDSTPEHIWEVDNDKQYGDVLSIAMHDVSNDGTEDLIVGRSDGMVEVYSFDDAGQPFQHFKHNFSESITSVDGGCVCAAGYEEVVVSTYTGWVLGLTTEPQQRSLGMPGTNLKDNINQEMEEKVLHLTQEIEALQQKVIQEREHYQQTALSDTAVSAVPSFNINDRFFLSHSDASYTLSIEVQMPIDTILLQSNVPVDLLDVEKNSAVVSYSTCDPESGNYLLATYRCQANTTRIELKIRYQIYKFLFLSFLEEL